MRLATIGLLLFAMTACTTTEENNRIWELVWQDEFPSTEANTPPRDSNWVYDIGTGDNGWGNAELQYYTDRAENIGQTGDGNLRITMLREDFEGSEWTSARITSKERFSFQYGRVEARIRTPVERSVWPAFWMLGADIDENPWPLAGEIDIMEVFGVRAVGGALHGPGYSGAQNIGFSYLVNEQLEGYADDYHIYEILWDPQQIVWLIDGNVAGVTTPGDLPPGQAWVFDHEFYFLLNMAVGGNPVQPVDDTTPDTAEMLVDYIKVFERREPLVDPLSPPDEVQADEE